MVKVMLCSGLKFINLSKYVHLNRWYKRLVASRPGAVWRGRGRDGDKHRQRAVRVRVLVRRALCDTAGCGKLSRDQFALAMWLVRRAAQGTPPPPRLTPDMWPPPALAEPAAPASQVLNS
ncbi:hypothetical protein ACJJTC_005698 [Scirpophaga incertulas]